MRILGVNAVFHDPAAALVVDGATVAAAEEERFSRRKHGKRPVPFSAWELPESAARWCLERAGITAGELDGLAYSYDPALVVEDQPGTDTEWEWLRTRYAERAPRFLATALPGLDPDIVNFVPHHVAHAASAALASPFGDCAVLVADGRGERSSYLAGHYEGDRLVMHAESRLPHSLGLRYEEVTEHLGFLRSSDEYKVMALASYGKPRLAETLREHWYAFGGELVAEPVPLELLCPPRRPGEEVLDEHADLAASAQSVVEEALLGLAGWLRAESGQRRLTLAGGLALNCVANTRIASEGPFEQVWVQPAAGDAGTALGAALQLAAERDEPMRPVRDVDLGREATGAQVEAALSNSGLPYEAPGSSEQLAEAVARALADDQIVAWFQGRSEFGPRALGHRSMLAHPGRAANVGRLNTVKGREQFRPVAPVVLAEHAAEIFGRGPLPSPYMTFVHDITPHWRERIPAVCHVDGTARIQTVEEREAPLLVRTLRRFRDLTGLPLLVNTSLNSGGRPMVDTPQDALECFGSAPIDMLVIGDYVLRRPREEFGALR
jgi:carbamoyltransferase